MKQQKVRGTLLLSAIMALSSAGSLAQQPMSMADHHSHEAMMSSEKSSVRSAKVTVPDIEVTDQNNHKLHFYRDLVQGKTVAINFIFTTCTTICPPMTANFASVQKRMLEHGDKNLHLISVTVDPENDTPAKLKSYAQMFNAQPGWTFVTGTRSQLELLWNAFSVTAGNKLDHSPTVAIGNDPRHQWVFASGLNSPEKLSNVIASVLDAKTPNAPMSAAK
jgi:cytochrome oxidase Cu insertion factor (SCO1/SenC/PrrC family)